METGIARRSIALQCCMGAEKQTTIRIMGCGIFLYLGRAEGLRRGPGAWGCGPGKLEPWRDGTNKSSDVRSYVRTDGWKFSLRVLCDKEGKWEGDGLMARGGKEERRMRQSMGRQR